MISATVAPERRWRISMTWVSLRERAEGNSSDLFGISVAAIGIRLGLDMSPSYVEKSTVLNFQQPPPFVKTHVFFESAALRPGPFEQNISVYCPDANEAAATSDILANPHVLAGGPVRGIPFACLGAGHGPVADDASLAAEAIGVSSLELQRRIQVAWGDDHHLPGAGCYVDVVRAGSFQFDVDVTGASVGG